MQLKKIILAVMLGGFLSVSARDHRHHNHRNIDTPTISYEPSIPILGTLGSVFLVNTIAKQNNVSTIKRFLLGAGTGIVTYWTIAGILFIKNSRALSYAAQQGDLAMVKYCWYEVGRLPSIGKVSKIGALVTAAHAGHLPIVKFGWKELKLLKELTTTDQFFILDTAINQQKFDVAQWCWEHVVSQEELDSEMQRLNAMSFMFRAMPFGSNVPSIQDILQDSARVAIVAAAIINGHLATVQWCWPKIRITEDIKADLLRIAQEYHQQEIINWINQQNQNNQPQDQQSETHANQQQNDQKPQNQNNQQEKQTNLNNQSSKINQDNQQKPQLKINV